MTVAAQYSDMEVLVLVWHGRVGDLNIQVAPRILHVKQALRTRRAEIVPDGGLHYGTYDS